MLKRYFSSSDYFVPNNLGFNHVSRDAVIQDLLLKNCSVQILTKPSWFVMERTYTFKQVHSIHFKGGHIVCRSKDEIC